MSVKMKGIDVSGYQGKIDFKAVKASGVEFVIIKAGISTNTVDTWENNFANAKNNGLKVGAYWYSKALSIEQATKEAQAFIAALKGKQLDFPVYLDLEEQAQFNKGKEFCTQLVEAFCGELENAGYYAGVYCSTYWFTNYVDEAVREKRPAWIADTRGQCYYKGTYGIWQYDAAEVEGVQNTCDRDWGYEDYSDYIKEHGLNGYSKEIVPPDVKKSVDELAREVINGYWGNGQERKDKLTAAGYSYTDVQARVNELLYPPKKTVDELAQGVLRGDWGAGDERFRKLTEAGYDYYQVQRRVNELIYSDSNRADTDAEIQVGSTVYLIEGAKTYDGKALASFVYGRPYVVTELVRDRAVICYGGAVVAAVNVEDLVLA